MGQNAIATGPDLRAYLAEVSRHLTERIEHQRAVLDGFLAERQQQGQPIDYCPLIDCRPKKRLREGLREAVAVLEETRRSFKSRRLEELRRKLEGLLAEDPI